MAVLKDVKTLDMVDGKITKVAYEGAEYEKTYSEVKAGDLFLLEDGHFVVGGDVGAFYSTKKHEDGDIVIPTAAIGSASYTQSIGKGVAFRKKHTRLKVGDYARVVDWPSRFKGVEGDLVKVLRDDRKQRPFHCELLNGNYVGQNIWARESELALATEAEVAAAKEAEAKRDVEAKWAKIGRKVGEYKVGDIVAYDDRCWFGNSGIGEVTEGVATSYNVRVAATDRGGVKKEFYLIKCRVTLITPVESRFDRS
ncbi:hypothetical protein ACQJZ4_07755 [Bacillus altitudinis]|uniref:hypothetical protein n=1 Tax=Bacillus altitudinis TaxID=293387 RepID=UPI003CFB65D0